MTITREQIIAWAREAGFVTGTRDWADGTGASPYVQPVATGSCLVELSTFAVLLEQAVREQCIDIAALHGGSIEIEAAIRAGMRG